MRKRWIRGVLTLGILGALAAGLLLSPAGAAAPLTKAKVKKIATKVFNQKIKTATAANAGAVNGNSISRFFFQADPNTTDAPIGTFGPITLKATCNGAGEPTLRASWNETVNLLTFDENGQSGTAELPANTTATLGSGMFGRVGLAQAVGYTTRTHTSVQHFIRQATLGPLGDEVRCFYSGFVTVG